MQVKTQIERLFRKTVNTEINSANKLLKKIGTKVSFSGEDEGLIELLKTNDLLTQSYANLEFEMSNKVNNILAEEFKKPVFNSAETKRKISKEVKTLSDKRINTIIRNEKANIESLSKEMQYKKAGVENIVKYKWIGPQDKRTSPISERIKRRTIKGVNMDRLKQIIREEADPRTYRPDRPFIPHINTRHTYTVVL